MGAYEEIIAEQRAAQQRELETARKRLFLFALESVDTDGYPRVSGYTVEHLVGRGVIEQIPGDKFGRYQLTPARSTNTRQSSWRTSWTREMSTPITEPARTMMANGPTPALLAGGPTVDVDDVLFRMLEPREQKWAMDFPRDYVMKGNKREQSRLAGNAVCPPNARDLIGVVAESLGVAS